MLNVSIVMSFITRYMHHRAMDPIRELIFFAFVAFIDIFMFMPVIFEVNKVKTDAEAIGMSTLFWKTRIPWDKIIRFDQPPFLKFACLRTARCFYLINKRDISPFGELASVITAKMSSQPKQIQDGESYDL